MLLYYQVMYFKFKGKEYNEEENIEIHNFIQYYLTNKYINLFLMLSDLYPNIKFSLLSSTPSIDSRLKISYPLYTDNPLLSEFNTLVYNNKKIR